MKILQELPDMQQANDFNDNIGVLKMDTVERERLIDIAEESIDNVHDMDVTLRDKETSE